MASAYIFASFFWSRLTVETRQAMPINYRLPSNRASDDDDDDDDVFSDDPKMFFKSAETRIFSN